jgi:hypothetical protein
MSISCKINNRLVHSCTDSYKKSNRSSDELDEKPGFGPVSAHEEMSQQHMCKESTASHVKKASIMVYKVWCCSSQGENSGLKVFEAWLKANKVLKTARMTKELNTTKTVTWMRRSISCADARFGAEERAGVTNVIAHANVRCRIDEDFQLFCNSTRREN